MTDHLPECPYAVFDQQGQIPATVIPGGCICSALRACEARVREEERALICVEQTALSELNAEYRKGVQAARDVVTAVADEYVGDKYEQGCMALRVALAAIDALPGES